ncbi:MAG: hypothetical protein U1C55_04075 [Smithellaceae bacterium]|nr:hypothetical protein [Smithellaceae bacterium]
MSQKKIRVIHYGLGPIGIETAKLALTKSSLEIVGAVDIAQDMAGRDLGQVLGLDRDLGITVTDNAKALFAGTRADVVIHTAGSRLKNIMSQFEEILAGRMNVVTSAEELLFPVPDNQALCEQLNQLAIKQGATILGTGVNPGFVMDALPAYLTSVCQDVKKVQVERVVDAATRRYPLQKKIGAAMSPEVFRAKIEEKAMGHVGLRESMYLLAAACGFSLDEVRETAEPVFSSKPAKTAYFELKAGDIAGIRNVALGIKGGETLITLDLQMYIGADDPHDAIYIEGSPSVRLRIEGGIAGDQATAAILVNNIPSVVTARPGLLTVRDVPLASVIR